MGKASAGSMRLRIKKEKSGGMAVYGAAILRIILMVGVCHEIRKRINSLKIKIFEKI